MTELVLVSAADESALVVEMRRVVGYIDRFPETQLVDLAFTCARNCGECAIAIIASDIGTLRARLASAADRLAAGNLKRLRDKSGTYYFREHLLGPGKGKLAFVYPGVMSFYPDMMRDLVIALHECREPFDELEEAMAGDSGFTPSSFVYPPAPYYRHDADIFKSGAYAQALVSTYAGCGAFTRLLRGCGLVPDGVVGFAGGDLAALMCAGLAGPAPTRPNRVKMISEIYRIVDKAVNHGGLPQVAMVSVLTRHRGEAEAVVETFPSGKATLAVDFSPRQKTYAVAKDFEEQALQAFAEKGIRAVVLALDRPFNTPMCATMVPAIYKFASNWMQHEPVYEVYSCAKADRLPKRLRAARKDTAERWAESVKFAGTVRKMYADGYRVFLEVGPRGLTTAAIADTLKDDNHAAIALNSIHRSAILQAQHAVGQLVALGAKMDVSGILRRRGAKKLDLDSTVPQMLRRTSEQLLSRAFPKLELLSEEKILDNAMVLSEPKGKGAKAARRADAIAKNRKRQQQRFDFGSLNPMVSDADVVASNPGVSVELAKVFRIADLPFIGDSALGTSQMSYSDPNLKGLVLLTLPVGAEIMAETASMVTPNGTVARIEDLVCRRRVSFENGELKLYIRAERGVGGVQGESSIKVQIRDDSPNSAYTSAVMEATVVIAEALPPARPVAVAQLEKPRSVHWSGRDIYPMRLCYGRRLRGIQFAEAWSDSGIDYEIMVPSSGDSVAAARFPIWAVNPLLMEVVVSGFKLWRSHEKFVGAFSFPFRLRRLVLGSVLPGDGSVLKCYMRFTEVTTRSHCCDITVTDGNGMVVMSLTGWEELTERVPAQYCELVMQPATCFLSDSLGKELIGNPATDVASAVITEVPYAQFERNEELWLKTVSHVVLDTDERRDFAQMTGSASRRTEWLFGRIAAKEAVRRYLKDYYQSRWSDADVRIWADDSGKPHALGLAWHNFLNVKLDLAIAHTAQFVVALVAANARVGVDVESVMRDLSDEFATGVFTPEELELAAQAANASQTIIKFWCAKEAVSKALGVGIRYSPKEMVVKGYLADAGTVQVRLDGAWADAFKNMRGRDIDVAVRTVRDHAIASCYIAASMFDD